MAVKQKGMVMVIVMITTAIVAGVSVAGMRVAKLDQLILAARYDHALSMSLAENALARAEGEWAALIAKCVIEGCDNAVEAFSVTSITLGAPWQVSGDHDLRPLGEVTFWGLERNAGILSLIYEITIVHSQLGEQKPWQSHGKTSAMQKLVMEQPAEAEAAYDSVRVQRLTWGHQ